MDGVAVIDGVTVGVLVGVGVGDVPEHGNTASHLVQSS
jgi:hypothetical protein